MNKYYFTLSNSHVEHHWPGRGGSGCVEITAPGKWIARDAMIANYGEKWAFQYEKLEDVHPLDRRILAVIP